MRLVEIRLLEGPNVYRLEPAVKIEIAIGRRRTWFGQRLPGAHARVRLGAPVSRNAAPTGVGELAAWVRRLHRLTGADAWLRQEREGSAGARRALPIAIHRSSDPGHWIVAFPWREQERALAIAEGAWRLADRGADPRRTLARGTRSGASRSLVRTLSVIRAAGTTPPPWIRDEQRRIPIVSVSGTNGKSTTTRMLTHILRADGRTVGTTTSDGVLVDEQMVQEGDWTGPGGAAQILERPDVEVGVLETARGGIVLRGVGYESNDAAVLTNVSSDHLDLHGIHTLPELAEVKSVIARITRPDGVVVLNADDPLVAAIARRVAAPVCLFSLRGNAPAVRRHVARGGRAMVHDEGWLVELEKDRRRRILPAADAPATLLGLARHNVANALAAAGAARGLGVSRSVIADGLRDFRPTAEQAPGRVNLYRVEDRIVIVDFAHNEAGITVVLDVAEGLTRGTGAGRQRRPLMAIVGTAGDRPDDTLRGIGRIAAQRADRVAIKETRKYLRGRLAESVVGEILAGMSEGGRRRGDVPVYESETAALRAVLTAGGGDGAAAPNEVIVLMCHEDRDGVAAVIAEMGGRPLDTTTELRGLLGP